MKIALLTNGIYPLITGGMQKHSYYLARYLAKTEVYVDVYYYKSKNKNPDLKDYFQESELEYITFYEFDFPASFYFPGHYMYNMYRYSCAVYEMLKNNVADIDFIYVQGFTALKLLKEKSKNSSFPPIAVNFHGLEMFQLTADTKSKLEQYLFRPPANFSLRKADIAISLGGKLTNILEKQTDESTRIWETPIGIEEKWLTTNVRLAQKPRTFVFIGRFERRKGIQELNKAIKKIHKMYNFNFEFIGPIPEANRLELSQCLYHGPVYDENKIIDIVSEADILVCPSYAEGMPTVILEGMSRGLAIIATDVGAVSELVSSETGWLINPANITELENALKQALITSDEKLQEKKEAALKLIERNFTWSQVVDFTLTKIKNYK